MTHNEMLALLPQRPPFLFVSRVVEVQEDRIVTQYDASPDASYFSGHFPGRPVMPGVLQCECCLQSGAILLGTILGDYEKDGIPVATRIKEAKFKRTVRPGDALNVEVTLDEELDDVFFMTGKVTVNEKTTTRIRFAVTVAPIGKDDA